MTTRARVMESAGIAEKYLSALRQRPSPLPLEPPAFPRRDHGLANVSVKPRQATPATRNYAQRRPRALTSLRPRREHREARRRYRIDSRLEACAHNICSCAQMCKPPGR
jgi:hypothetical protein